VGEVSIEVRTLVAITIVVLMATSSAFARKASHHHSKRTTPKASDSCERDAK